VAVNPPPPPPKVSTPKPATKTTTKPAGNPTQEGVHPGAFCSPHLAFGHTSTGKLMQCKTSATDVKYRWRAV
jgi:hypothetical protein